MSKDTCSLGERAMVVSQIERNSRARTTAKKRCWNSTGRVDSTARMVGFEC